MILMIKNIFTYLQYIQKYIQEKTTDTIMSVVYWAQIGECRTPIGKVSIYVPF
jgi:hypothetical protein